MSGLVQCGMNSSSSPSRHLTSNGLDDDEDISTKILGPSASLICEDIHLITNFLCYVGNNDDDFASYNKEYDGPPQIGDIY